MGIFSGLFRSRDKPTDSTTGGTLLPCWRHNLWESRDRTVCHADDGGLFLRPDSLSEAIAGLPIHLYRSDDDGSKEKATDHPLYLLLHDEPNPEMTSFVFREALMTLFCSGAMLQRRLSETAKVKW